MNDQSVGSETELVAMWERLMASFPPDGWYGAASLIAAHDQQVMGYERMLDVEVPGWYERLIEPPWQRRTSEAR